MAGKRFTTHSFRHTTAMHLFESGLEANVVKAWLGHAQLKSLDPYTDANLTHKRRVLERFSPPNYVMNPPVLASGNAPEDLLAWLKGL